MVPTSFEPILLEFKLTDGWVIVGFFSWAKAPCKNSSNVFPSAGITTLPEASGWYFPNE